MKELATWFEEKVIVRPEQISVKKPEIPPKPMLVSSKTYDSNNNKRIVGELVSFFCSQSSPRPRPQPISESRVNVMNLIETFEKRAENNSRHYPFIPLHVEHFVWNNIFSFCMYDRHTQVIFVKCQTCQPFMYYNICFVQEIDANYFRMCRNIKWLDKIYSG